MINCFKSVKITACVDIIIVFLFTFKIVDLKMRLFLCSFIAFTCNLNEMNKRGLIRSRFFFRMTSNLIRIAPATRPQPQKYLITAFCDIKNSQGQIPIVQIGIFFSFLTFDLIIVNLLLIIE